MFANREDYKARLTIAPRQSLIEVPSPSIFPLPGEAEFPSPPSLPNTLVQLESCLSSPVADLQNITNVIKNDIGLTVQLLRLAARVIEESPAKVIPIDEIVIHVGIEKLRTLVARAETLSGDFRNRSGFSACERFWMHSRLTALISEELARRSYEITPEEAYLAGLLSHLGDLCSLLGWKTVGSGTENSRGVGYQMASAWKFPRILVDAIGGAVICSTRKSRVLFDVATDADMWASRLEFLAARESPAIRAKNPPYYLGHN